MGCLWGRRNNNSYVSTHKTDRVCTADGKCYNYNDVFVDEVDPGHSNTCGQTCYVACSCNTSNGWYSSCQGSDCFSVTDTRYAGKPNAASASRSISDVASISASGANSGISAMAAANSGLKTASAAGNYTATAASAAVATAGATSGISTMASGATTCYKKKTCSEGGYYDSVPADQKCSSKSYNGYSCYTGCSYKTCSDYGYNSSVPSGKTCTKVAYANLSCYTDCTIIQGNPRLIVNWSYGAGISTPGVRLDAKKNGNSVLLGMMKSGTSGTLIYEDVAVGDLISSFSGYGIANDSTSGSESFNISANVPSVSISEAKDYYINVTLSPADRTPAPNTKADLAVGCYLPSGYTCTISSNTPCSLKGADGKGIGYNLWSGGMSYGSGDMDAGQSVTIDVNSEIKCETGSYYTFVVDYIEIGGKKVDSNTRSFYLKANGDPGNVWVRYRLK